MRRVSAVVLAYLEQPWLEDCVEALLSSRGVEVEVIVVDNGSAGEAIDHLAGRDRVKVLIPGKNLGFAGGCNFGVSHAGGEVIALINGDAVLEPDTLARLAEVAMRPDVGIATASIRLADRPDRINSAGNPIHFLGINWAGGFGEDARAHSQEREVAGASGAAMAVRREVWDLMEGFEERYFAYQEDADLSLRCRQRALKVVYAPEAVVFHHYEFSRNPEKFYLLERNRLIFLATLFERRTLAAIALPLVFFEAGTFLVSLLQGWWRQNLAAWRWLATNLSWIRNRRALVQAERTVGDREIVALLESRVRPGNYPLPAVLRPFDWLLAGYWSLVRRMI